MLSRDEARAFYDHFGAKQDSQWFYEGPAVKRLLAQADFETAGSVFELGCGTGHLAEILLQQHLPKTASYQGSDLSTTMVGLARSRLAAFAERATVQLTDGSMRTDAADATFDRFVSNYVLDLLTPEDIPLVLAEAHRILKPDGRLCVVSLTPGTTAVSRLLTWGWTHVHRFRPSLVGGCRPIELLDFVSAPDWRVDHRSVVVAYGVPSEVVVARKAAVRAT